MIDKINQHNNNSELSARKTLQSYEPQKPQSTQSAKSSGSPASNIPRSAASLSSALGLPQDKLSSAIISFAKFFSLPLKPQLLANLRRYAFMPSATEVAATKIASQNTNQFSSTANAAAAKSVLANANAAGDANASLTTEKTRQALSLSAAAAESKGLELNQKGLESYAQAVDPESRRQDGDHQRRRRDREQYEQEEETLKTEAVKKTQHGESTLAQLTADSLKKMSLEYAEQNPLLKILNRLPCKNGQRWIALPFDFNQDGKDFFVSMRVLLDDEHSINRAACMALDILESARANHERRWLFVMESANDKPLRISLYLQDEPSQKNHSMFKRELSNLFNLPPEHINIINRTEPFPYEASFADNFSSIDEAV